MIRAGGIANRIASEETLKEIATISQISVSPLNKSVKASSVLAIKTSTGTIDPIARPRE